MPSMSSEDYCTRMGAEIKSGAFWRDGFVELLSTFLLTAGTIFLWVVQTDQGTIATNIALGMVFLWVSINYGLGDYGGAHSNPAITFACLIRAEISILKALIYWIMQCIGALAGAFFVFAIKPEDLADVWYYGVPILNQVSFWQGILLEGWITMVLCMAYLASFNIHRKGYVILSSLPVGFALGHGTLVSLLATGACMNPARSLGTSLMAHILNPDGDQWDMHWVWWVGPMGGAMLAAIFFWIFDSADRPAEGVYSGPRAYVKPAASSGNHEVLNGSAGYGNDVFTVNGPTNVVSGNGYVSAYNSLPAQSAQMYSKY